MTSNIDTSQLFIEGIPRATDGRKLKKTVLYQMMKKYNDAFMAKYSGTLSQYNKRWAAKPFYHWSRQYEYPFVFHQLAKIFRAESNEPLSVLDAGSGCTFFPYYLDNSLNLNVHCCDIDESLQSIFTKINNTEEKTISFLPCDLRVLKYSDASFDALYCISVLEHTTDHESIFRQFRRVLKPDGLLVLTFDIVLDDDGLENAKCLLDKMSELFRPSSPTVVNAENEMLSVVYVRNTERLLFRFPNTRFGVFLAKAYEILRRGHRNTSLEKKTIHCSTWKSKSAK